jgi:uncharacterized protein YjbI with pentapeptide repeats
VAVTVIIAIINAPSFPSWTGINGKTAWDLFEMLLIPLALALVGIWFGWQQKAWELKIAEEQRKLEQQIARDRIEETRLQDYFDRMTDLLLRENLCTVEEGSEVRSIARARTLNILSNLSGDRKGGVLRFLAETKLIVSEHPQIIKPIISLTHADLSDIKLSVPLLQGADLRGADLRNADLTGLFQDIPIVANLQEANLQGANLQGANLSGAWLQDADLEGANLQDANLSGCNLKRTILTRATLQGANLDHIRYDNTMNIYWPNGYTPPPTAINTSRLGRESNDTA